MVITTVCKLIIPSGHFVEHAQALQCSSSLRERLRQAPAVVALWPNGAQQVVWGQDYLTSHRALGHSRAHVLLLRVDDDEDVRFLLSVVIPQKQQDVMPRPGSKQAWTGCDRSTAAGAFRPRPERLAK